MGTLPDAPLSSLNCRHSGGSGENARAARCSPEVIELPAGERDALWDLVERYYAPVQTVEDFGQAHTRLRILQRRTGAVVE